MDDLVTCEYCGNVWDGNAQCNCYESMIEPDEQIMDMVSSSNNIAVETGNEQQVETDEQIMGLVPPSSHNSVETEVVTEVETGNKKEKPVDETDDIDEIDIESQKSDTSIDEIIEL